MVDIDPEVAVAANGEATVIKDNKDDYMLKLKVPLITPDGKTVTELSVDTSKIKMTDLHQLEMEYGVLFPDSRPTNGIFISDSKYQSMVIARINGMMYESLSQLSAKDSLRLFLKFSSFLGDTA